MHKNEENSVNENPTNANFSKQSGLKPIGRIDQSRYERVKARFDVKNVRYSPQHITLDTNKLLFVIALLKSKIEERTLKPCVLIHKALFSLSCHTLKFQY